MQSWLDSLGVEYTLIGSDDVAEMLHLVLERISRIRTELVTSARNWE
jgi:hypothetical protein